jgi:hypothetical protein
MRRHLLLGLAGVFGLLVVALGVAAALGQPARWYHDQVVIEASRPEIWGALTDLEHYADWNPYITSAHGSAVEGETVTLAVTEGDGGTEQREVEIVIVKPRRKLEWRSRFLAPGLLDRERAFRVIPLGPDGRRWRVMHDLRVEGLVSPFADVAEDRAGGRSMLDALARHLSHDGR